MKIFTEIQNQAGRFFFFLVDNDVAHELITTTKFLSY